METRTTFSDSNSTMSNETNSICNNTSTLTSPSSQQHQSSSDIQSLKRLSENLTSILQSKTLDFYSDVNFSFSDGRQLAAHICILSARSSFFRNLFFSKRRKARFEMKELAREFDVGFEAMVCVLEYVYGGKVRDLLPKGVCVCVDDDGCDHLSCRPVVDFVLQVLYASFVFEVYELVDVYQRYLLEVLDKVQIDDMLVILSIANLCGKACDKLLTKCAEIIVKSDIDIVTLEKSLPHPIVKQITDSRHELGLEGNTFPDKHVKRIHRALDSDDVELLRMLLKEGHSTLDDAHALHYAVTYCDAKTTTELLELGLADVSLRNVRGYTVLHVAAMRKDPKIIVSLLTKGARPSDLTSDGRRALQIAKRLTRAIDYHKSTEEGKSSPKDRLCIEVLEQAERRDPLLGEASVSLSLAGDDLRMKLLYLENRVGLAKLLFPMEAKVAMDIARVDGTSEFPLRNIRSKNTMYLNDSPFRIQEEHLNRLRALSRTVELGKRFFPRCSEVLNKIMNANDLSELASMRECSGEERLLKERRYNELKDLLTLAFTEDKEEFGKSTILSSSSSTSMEVVRSNINLAAEE